MKTKGLIVVAILLLFGFFYQSSALAKWVSDSYQPIVEEIGHNRDKNHNIFTVLSYMMIHSFVKNPYLTPSDVVESDHPMIKSLANDITEGMTTDLEKSRAIYTWVTENIEYDADYYYEIQYLSDFEFDSALETLEKRKSLCMGIAHLSAALHRSVGIEAKIVYGEHHAWNEVLIDGRWLSQDATKGAGYLDERSKEFVQAPSMEYFGTDCNEKEGEYLW